MEPSPSGCCFRTGSTFGINGERESSWKGRYLCSRQDQHGTLSGPASLQNRAPLTSDLLRVHHSRISYSSSCPLIDVHAVVWRIDVPRNLIVSHELIGPILAVFKSGPAHRGNRAELCWTNKRRKKPYGHSDDGIGICGRHIDYPVLSPSSDSHLAHQIGERPLVADVSGVHRRSDLLGRLRTLDRLDTDHADKRRDLPLGWDEFVAEVALWMRTTWSHRRIVEYPRTDGPHRDVPGSAFGPACPPYWQWPQLG
jgi:hypothetical protein